MAPFTRTLQRATAIDFASQPYYQEEASAIYLLPGTADKGWQFVHPFQWEVWSMLGASILLASNIYRWINKLSYAVTGKRNARSFRECILHAYRAIICQGTVCIGYRLQPRL